MNNIKKLLMVCSLLVLIIQCKSPEYLPLAKDVDTFTYGSYIVLLNEWKEELGVEGEFIAIDDEYIYVMVAETKKTSKHLEKVAIPKVGNFELKYAKSSNYTKSTVISLLSVLSHGFIAGITLPVNIVVTLIANDGGRAAFTYEKEELPMEKIKMFSRFPQGLPEGVPLNAIK